MTKLKTLAAIDIGTNSFRLLIVSVDPIIGKFKILHRQKESVRLGTGSGDMKYLTESAIQRGIAALQRFRTLADSAKAEVRAIATSAAREAVNQDDFIRRVYAETGIKIEIASGFEEARLTYLGVLRSLPVFKEKILMIDIGGGSTEFLVGHRGEILYDNSLKLGAIRMTQEFFTDKVLNAEQISNCRKQISGLIDHISRDLKTQKVSAIVGCSGTILNIARMIKLAKGGPDSDKINGYSFSNKDLAPLVAKILSAKKIEQRAKIPGLDSGRADIIVAGAIILEQIFSQLKIRDLSVSEFALREGIVLDTIEKKFPSKKQNLHDNIRYKSVLHLAEHFEYEKEHSHHVALLALQLFDQTKPLHKLGSLEREYLESAALLHEIGSFVSHAEHHKHSHYLIRHSSLLGFTETEQEIIADVARYHRKSIPKSSHEGYNRLMPDEQLVVRKLAAILRIADGLDKTHSQKIKKITAKKVRGSIAVKLYPVGKTSLDYELWGAERKKDLFEETFGVKLSFKTT